MSKVHRTPEELVQIYTFFTEGDYSRKQVAEYMQLPYGSVVGAYNKLNKYLTGNHREQGKYFRSYLEAAKLIRKQKRIVQRSEQPAPALPTVQAKENVTFLKKKFEEFQQAASTFIEVEINSRYESIRRENLTLREENDKLRQEIENLRNNNWVDILQEKLTKEEE